MTPRKPTVKVRRIKPGCCGMNEGQVYEAEWDIPDFYIDVKLSEDSWSGPHWFKDHFEIVTEENG